MVALRAAPVFPLHLRLNRSTHPVAVPSQPVLANQRVDALVAELRASHIPIGSLAVADGCATRAVDRAPEGGPR
jgi:hypothetical protein